MITDAQNTAQDRDRRGAPRQQVKVEATVTFGTISVDCIVRNISATGVVIHLPKWHDIPDQVNLTLTGEEAVRPAVVVRRLAPNIALHFTTPTVYI